MRLDFSGIDGGGRLIFRICPPTFIQRLERSPPLVQLSTCLAQCTGRQHTSPSWRSLPHPPSMQCAIEAALSSV